MTKQGIWIPVIFIEYGKLRRTWQYLLLTTLKRQMPKTKENSRLIDNLFKNHPEGFYIYAKRRVKKPKKTVYRPIRTPSSHSRITHNRVQPRKNTVELCISETESRRQSPCQL